MSAAPDRLRWLGAAFLLDLAALVLLLAVDLAPRSLALEAVTTALGLAVAGNTLAWWATRASHPWAFGGAAACTALTLLGALTRAYPLIALVAPVAGIAQLVAWVRVAMQLPVTDWLGGLQKSAILVATAAMFAVAPFGVISASMSCTCESSDHVPQGGASLALFCIGGLALFGALRGRLAALHDAPARPDLAGMARLADWGAVGLACLVPVALMSFVDGLSILVTLALTGAVGAVLACVRLARRGAAVPAGLAGVLAVALAAVAIDVRMLWISVEILIPLTAATAWLAVARPARPLDVLAAAAGVMLVALNVPGIASPGDAAQAWMRGDVEAAQLWGGAMLLRAAYLAALAARLDRLASAPAVPDARVSYPSRCTRSGAPSRTGTV